MRGGSVLLVLEILDQIDERGHNHTFSALEAQAGKRVVVACEVS